MLFMQFVFYEAILLSANMAMDDPSNYTFGFAT